MKELIREADFNRIGLYRQLLESEGIQTFVRNENLSNLVATGIPLFYPALCVVNAEDEDRAWQLIEAFEQAPPGDPNRNVRCGSCGEESPETFAQCWNCDGLLHGTE
jgi:hypothetical protein